MNRKVELQLALEPYKVLDLTDEKGMLCGRLLGDLGADVIKIELPGGDLARNIGPFYQDVPHLEKSLNWFIFNSNKRGITLDLQTSDGREIFKRLVRTADFIIESFEPGYLQELGLDYAELNRINSRVILVSISPFGQSGPYKDFKSTDIVSMAMGGLMNTTGESDRPPVRVGVSQSHIQAGVQAAIAALIAHWPREFSGTGQWIDVSLQESIIPTVNEILPHWQFGGQKVGRSGSYIFRGKAWQRSTWPCKDGQIGMRILTGVYSDAIVPLIEWMDEEGMAGKLKGILWEKIDIGTITQEEYDSWELQFLEFFMKHTKAELYSEAIKRGIHLLPANDPGELIKDEQLISREYWIQVEHKELGATFAYPGPFAGFSRTPVRLRKRAPFIGEHNQEVYRELGINPAEQILLKASGVI